MSAVVTGIGVLTPNAAGLSEYWSATLAGRSGIGTISSFDADGYPARLAGEVTGFDPAKRLPQRLLPQTDRMTRMALVASDWALADAALSAQDLPEYSAGVVTASSSGGFEFGQRELHRLWSRGPKYVSAYQSFAWFYAVNTGQISIRHDLRGPGSVLVADQAGGLDALGQARRQLRKGGRMVVTGGMEGSLCPWGWSAHLAGGRLSTRDDAGRAYLPFDEDANGWVAGEGGAILIVEDSEAAARRGAPRVYGTIAGYAATFDPRPGSGRPPGLRRAAEGALADAGVRPADIDVVFADAAGVAELDRAEAEAVTGLFGPRGVPVTAPKSATGRLSSGAGPVDVAAALLTLNTGRIPPTPNVSRPAPEHRLDLVLEPRTAPVRTALVLARGHGGFNSAVVVRAAAAPVQIPGPRVPAAPAR
ncbi:ketosynthase chain-length factor [Streptomyces sp. SID11385]|uniref:ketosynthase chain-length factor n=1 Tax=Streptomyces sp. SID11385 TaxID=2706031 RepID=UPI0013CD283C|nr:ketosynthase chain-length factor [Streptomyces sp. SID11385]NEA44197.1 ketosynthase chain-length factor [Streptomyces sp. SID11385]